MSLTQYYINTIRKEHFGKNVPLEAALGARKSVRLRCIPSRAAGGRKWKGWLKCGSSAAATTADFLLLRVLR